MDGALSPHAGEAAAGRAEGADRWVLRPIRLAFRLGPLTLLRQQLRFGVLDAHFTTLGTDLDAVRPPFAAWEKDVAGALVMNQPVPPGAPLARVTFLPGVIRYVPARLVNYYTSLSGTFEELLGKNLNAKSRTKLRAYVKKVAERSGGTADLRAYGTPEEMAEFFAHARAVAAKTYQEKLNAGALPSDAEFQAEMRSAAARGKVRGYILFVGGAPAAYLYCPIQDRAIIYEHIGYDPAFRDLSPGTVLQYLVLERLFREQELAVFDLTEGEGLHKERYATGSVECAHVYFFRRNAGNYCRVLAHAALLALTRGTGALLGRLRVRDRVRKLVRGQRGE